MRPFLFVLSIIFFCANLWAMSDEPERFVVEIQQEKYGPISFAVEIDTSGKIAAMELLKIARAGLQGEKVGKKRFLRQFIGKGLDDPIMLRKDIDAVTGATTSSEAACEAAREALERWKALAPLENGISNGACQRK